MPLGTRTCKSFGRCCWTSSRLSSRARRRRICCARFLAVRSVHTCGAPGVATSPPPTRSSMTSSVRSRLAACAAPSRRCARRSACATRNSTSASAAGARWTPSAASPGTGSRACSRYTCSASGQPHPVRSRSTTRSPSRRRWTWRISCGRPPHGPPTRCQSARQRPAGRCHTSCTRCSCTPAPPRSATTTLSSRTWAKATLRAQQAAATGAASGTSSTTHMCARSRSPSYGRRPLAARVAGTAEAPPRTCSSTAQWARVMLPAARRPSMRPTPSPRPSLNTRCRSLRPSPPRPPPPRPPPPAAAEMAAARPGWIRPRQSGSG
mmetsp:Transcript_19481/g.64396  ORF Transcript_19481/g.64396 Transcript_19481/m.64396 type:complete len:322 (+) Transcript_19481:648-1613(+)